MTSLLRVCALAAAVLTCSSTAFSGIEKVRSTSVVVIYATEEGGLARDCVDADCRSGPLAKAIETALKTQGVTISGLFDAVNADVGATTQLSQKPRLETSGPINVPLVRNPGRASALVIGNGAYANLVQLKGAPRDAEIVSKALGDAGFQTRTVIDAKLPALNATLHEFFSGLGVDDTAIVYYAGHGLQIDGENYLPAIEAEALDAKALTSSSIAVSELMDGLSRSKADRRILILDTHFPRRDADAAYKR